jgi:hypothetical protein
MTDSDDLQASRGSPVTVDMINRTLIDNSRIISGLKRKHAGF